MFYVWLVYCCLIEVELVSDFEGIANARCHITQMISWCNVRVARTGNVAFLWLCVDFVLSFWLFSLLVFSKVVSD